MKDITLHIAAAHPTCVNREEIPEAVLEREKEIYRGQVKGKPENIVEKIVEGKAREILQHRLPARSGVHQEPRTPTIRDLVSSKITELGENIIIRRFTRYMVGEQLESDAPAAETVE